jgi:DNA-binding NarL/FixJ family response regulator
MTTRTILLVGREPFESERLRRVVSTALPLRVCCVAEVGDGADLLRRGQFGLIVVHLGKGEGWAGVDEILWSASLAKRPVPVIALSDHYDPEVGLTLFRMGVTDYLALSDHRQKLPRLLESLMAPAKPGSALESEGCPAAVARAGRASRV